MKKRLLLLFPFPLLLLFCPMSLTAIFWLVVSFVTFTVSVKDKSVLNGFIIVPIISFIFFLLYFFELTEWTPRYFLKSLYGGS